MEILFAIVVACVLGALSVAVIKNSNDIKSLICKVASNTFVNETETKPLSEIDKSHINRLVDECEKWHTNYEREHKSHLRTISVLNDVSNQLKHVTEKLEVTEETLINVSNRLTQTEREVKTLKYIVEKLDGKKIERDDDNKIIALRVAK